MRHSTSELNYTNQWFKMVWFWYLLRIMGAVGFAGFVAVGLMITAWAPEWTPLYIRAVFAAIGIAFLLCIVWFFVAVFRVFFAKPYQPRQPDEWRQNPPADQPWWDKDGNMLWERSGNGWRPIQRHQSLDAHDRPSVPSISRRGARVESGTPRLGGQSVDRGF